MSNTQNSAWHLTLKNRNFTFSRAKLQSWYLALCSAIVSLVLSIVLTNKQSLNKETVCPPYFLYESVMYHLHTLTFPSIAMLSFSLYFYLKALYP